ncbi:hypothetical protein JTE90_002356 [Oedothorax gibbosus]|uniref:Gag-pol polyprotein n=1 Tax=Oedothorax gibbosus TaxID=931172 RepID=A0AAV6UK48_9ARAC|nr:hypothetical protein JTE90_002356 [Oedothorax gibbosus]
MEVSQIEKLDASNYGVWKEDVRFFYGETVGELLPEKKYPTEVELTKSQLLPKDPKIFVKQLKKLRLFYQTG